ncbi:bifunctional lysylphosphatidylglycerol flippase/synthetase MprF [Microbacterium sp. GXF7504]
MTVTRTRLTPLAVLRRIPATLSVVGLLLVVGVLTTALWTPFERHPLWDTLAYGLPAFEAGRWWTPLTGTFIAARPWVYAIVIVGFWGMAFLEYKRGSRVALLYFGGGQLFAVLAGALSVWLLSLTGWPWAVLEAGMLDVGPSGGGMACIAAAITLFRPPWRVRAWLVLLAFVIVMMMFWGSLDDIEHLLAVLLVLGIDRSLHIQRATLREQRLVAFIVLVTLGVVEIIAFLVPTDGPFGSSEPVSGGIWDVAIDIVVITVLANGLRRGRRWAWVLALVLTILNVLAFAATLTAVQIFGETDVEVSLNGDVSLSLALGSLWVPLLVYLLWVRKAFRAHRKADIGTAPEPNRAEVREQLRAHGGGTLSWMTTWDGLRYARTGDGIVAYQRRAGVALALADPIGPEPSRDASVERFIADAERAGLIPCFFSAGEDTRAAVPAGWRRLIVADDTIVDLPGLQFTGKAWASIRTSLNRAEREGVTFRLAHLHELSWGVRAQLRTISEGWVGDKGLPEMGFTLGTLTEAEDPEVRIALATAPNGDVEGFLSWLPVYGEAGAVRGWTLDLMRRRDGGFPPVMEFLIGSSAKAFSEEGAEIMSLSGAPLSHEYPADAGVIADLSAKLAEMLEPVYGFRSLHRFKEKFHPRYETMYLLFRDESDLTRIGLALTRAFLPTATFGQLAGAGLELVRGGGNDKS